MTTIYYALEGDTLNYKVLIESTNEVKKISSHRFVKLLEGDPYGNNLSQRLDFLGITTFKGNAVTEIGKYLELPILEEVLQHKNYLTYSYEEYQGDCLNDNLFSGLLDGYCL